MNQNLFAIAALYTGVGALILLWLSSATISLRAKHKISIGDEGNKHLTRIMRGHSNAVENMIILLILLIMMAALGTPAFILHGYGMAIIISRALHAHHFISGDAPRGTRFYPMVVNQILLLFGGLGIIGNSVRILFF